MFWASNMGTCRLTSVADAVASLCLTFTSSEWQKKKTSAELNRAEPNPTEPKQNANFVHRVALCRGCATYPMHPSKKYFCLWFTVVQKWKENVHNEEI